MIIKGSSEHAAVLTELGVETFYSSHKESSPPHEIDAYMKKIYNAETISKELDNPANIYHLIKHEDAFAGFSKIKFSVKHPKIEKEIITKMDQIYLLDSFQGLKLGAKLMSFNIELSKSHGDNGMWLAVWIHNNTAITFYKKFGFEIVLQDYFQLTPTHRNPCYIMFLDYDNNLN